MSDNSCKWFIDKILILYYNIYVFNFRQYRTTIVRQYAVISFVSLYRKAAGVLMYVKGFCVLCDGKFASIWRTKPSGGGRAVLP